MDKLEGQTLKKRNANLEKELEEKTKELYGKNRELEIVSALEKVRARAITMRSSSELSETSVVLFQQLNELGIRPIRSGVGIFDDANNAMELWLTTVSNSKEVVKILDYFSLHIHPVFENIIPARQQKKPFAVTVLKGNDVRQYYQTMSTYLSQSQNVVYHDEEYFYSFFFLQGTLNVITGHSLTEEECTVMIQFALVFGLIYTRFLDLQIAESQTLDAIRQTSLDRVRAEIASMRNVDDLQRIIPLIWKELVTLGVPFFRCGVFIISEKDQLVHAYLSTPEGKALAVLHLPFDGADITTKIVENWRQKTVFADHWDRQQFETWVQSMIEQGQIKGVKQYQASDEQLVSLRLQFIPFDQGMLYVGNDETLSGSEIDLIKSLADSFSVAYARYEDFKQLEESKNHVEATLTKLKAAQSQLIQSEKMASLGELTAGIAHEIQNPLNFVNNFSEVSAEMVKEIKDERLKTGDERDEELEGEILSDLEQNLQKINHHGGRASSIVKGMLEHSRTSTGEKVPTDINALCDECLRLSYHGLRAKDKSFNAAFETHFDKELPKVKVISQDIGRVLLNVVNNAFYAVNNKKKTKADTGYTPKVEIRTQEISPSGEPAMLEHRGKGKNRIEISIRDNGEGMSKETLEKVFQPFFTTKPAGQGTGLGMSLSYDIITKGHGGELKVESEEGKGTMFVILLPIV